MSNLPPPIIEVKPGSVFYGTGEPPVKGAEPAITYRDMKGNLHIQLHRARAGPCDWNVKIITDGWVLVYCSCEMHKHLHE